MQWNNIRVLPGTATLQLSMQLWIAAWFHPNWYPKNHWRDVSLSSTIIYCDCKNWNGSSLKYDDYKNKKKLDDVCFSVNDDSSMDDPPLLELGNTRLCKSWFTCAVFYCTAGSIVRLYLHVNILSLDFLIQFIWNWLVLYTNFLVEDNIQKWWRKRYIRRTWEQCIPPVSLWLAALWEVWLSTRWTESNHGAWHGHALRTSG